jgi:hypothetical protein
LIKNCRLLITHDSITNINREKLKKKLEESGGVLCNMERISSVQYGVRKSEEEVKRIMSEKRREKAKQKAAKIAARVARNTARAAAIAAGEAVEGGVDAGFEGSDGDSIASGTPGGGGGGGGGEGGATTMKKKRGRKLGTRLVNVEGQYIGGDDDDADVLGLIGEAGRKKKKKMKKRVLLPSGPYALPGQGLGGQGIGGSGGVPTTSVVAGGEQGGAPGGAEVSDAFGSDLPDSFEGYGYIDENGKLATATVTNTSLVLLFA